MKTVLAPIDFSPISRLVVDEAIVIARGMDARLVLLHVVPPATALATEFAEKEFGANHILRAEKRAMAELTAWQSRLRDEGVTAHAIHRIGQPGSEILDQAERLDADYIVMGSHGHGAFYELLVGSTTMRVLNTAKCAVMIVSPKASAYAKRKVDRRFVQRVTATREARAAAIA